MVILKHYRLLRLFFLFALLLIPLCNAMAKVTASTGRTVLSIDETILLQITAKNNSGEPDFSVLEEGFQILTRSQSQNYSLINGKASRTHTWSISLLAKKTGEVSIPEIEVGDEKSQTIHLIIRKPSATPGADGKEAFLKISIADDNQDEFYVQQQILVKLQLFHRIRFTNATLSELELNNTVIEKLGEDNSYSKMIAKHRYNIIERIYAIYPQQSGELIIPAITFNGNVEVSQNFSLFSRPGRQIISRTKAVKLNILPIPEHYSGKNWLPAEKLVIESEILEDIDTIKSGEAVTRHIVVRATGLLGSQLPPISVPSSKAIKTYPDKEKLNTQLINGKVVGSRRDTIAIIPLKEGEFTLPEIKIDWWNIKTRQQEIAVLEAKNLLAQQNTEIEADPVKAPIPPTIADTSDVNIPENIKEIVEKVVYKNVALSKNIWFWISLGLLIIWLVTLILLIMIAAQKKSSKRKYSLKNKVKNTREEHQQLLQNLYGYCLNNDAHSVSDALVYWAQHYFNKPLLTGLSQIIDLIEDKEFINAINTLESSQYSANKQSWTGNDLSQCIKEFIRQDQLDIKSQEQRHQGFTALNP
ncbi:MAG: BatD family protein [gamma proteobacterium symbiont of Taylorina sp.]|nr:BatD family protein [gamma proteobacterium symbiont of Taylorina sp.]